jgi:hypothetical protein
LPNKLQVSLLIWSNPVCKEIRVFELKENTLLGWIVLESYIEKEELHDSIEDLFHACFELSLQMLLLMEAGL